ncbi:MAG: RUS1 family protein, partial [Candidatus Xenobia bacterium]
MDDSYITYNVDSNGQVSSPDTNHEDAGLLTRMRKLVWNFVVPENMNESVSKDYARSRLWQAGRDFMGAFGGVAAVGAVAMAVGPANGALAALSIASLTVTNVNYFRDRIGQASSIATSKIARLAEKNPKAWMAVSDVITNVGTIADAATVIMPPTWYYPEQILMSVLRSAGGAASAAASANVAPRQAIKSNLSDVTVKNNNQGTISTFLGATCGAATVAALTPVLGIGGAVLTVAAAGSVVGFAAYCGMLASLEYGPVNETGVRDIIHHMKEHHGEIPPPPGVWKSVRRVGHVDRLVIGDRVKPLLEDKDFDQL